MTETEKLTVALGARSYDIVIGRGQLASLGARIAKLRPGAKVAIVSDKNVATRHLDATVAAVTGNGLQVSTIVLPPGESTKSFKHLASLCDELIARKLPIQWFGNARADNLTDPAFVRRLKQAGCWMLALGIESESDEVRKNMVKRLERQKIQSAFRNMRDAGIRSAMLGRVFFVALGLVAALGTEAISGVGAQLVVSGDITTGTLRLKATFPNADQKLWPGQFVNVRLVLADRKGVTTVPQRTVMQGPGGYFAYVVKPDGTVTEAA